MNDDRQEPNQEPISSTEIAELRDELQSLKRYVESNRRRIRNGKALNALLAITTPFLLLSGDFHFGKEWSANLKSRDIDTADAISLMGVGLTALGVVTSEELGKIFMRR